VSGRGAPARVLVVEDEPDIRQSVADALEGEGYQVAVAENGAEALQVVASFRPAVILLDMKMPIMDGWTLVRTYRRTPPPHSRIVVFTAAADAARRAAETGADGVVAKPFDLDDLLRTVATHAELGR
jgi:CheY-like chemotaxis protein